MTTYYYNGAGELYPYSGGASSSSAGSVEGYPYAYGYCPERHEFYFPGSEVGDRPRVQTININGYTIQVSPGQRKYGGPPLDWTDPPPGEECEIYCGRLPRHMFEDELLPLFEKYGRIWEMRLMMNDYSNKNRGFAFVRYAAEDSAMAAISHLNDISIDDRPHRKLRVEACAKKVRLYIANIPKVLTKEELREEFDKRTKGLKEVIIYAPADDKDQVKKNRGFCFLDYDTHFNAFAAKKHLSKGVRKIWGCELVVDWADPIKEPEQEVMAKVKVLYVRNLTSRVTEERLQALFSTYGVVERVKRLKDFAFVHFTNRAHAEKALKEQQGEEFCGTHLHIEWGKPPEDKRQLEEILRARERRMADGYHFSLETFNSMYPAGYGDYSAQAYDQSFYDPASYYDYDYYNQHDYEYPHTAAPYYPPNLGTTMQHRSPMYYPDSTSSSSPEVYRRGPPPDEHRRPGPSVEARTRQIQRSPSPPERSQRSNRNRNRRAYRSDRDSKPSKSTKRSNANEDNWRRNPSSSSRRDRDYSHGEPQQSPSSVTPPHSASNPNSPVNWRRR